MKKILLSLFILTCVGYEPMSFAENSGLKTLGNMMNRVDSYKVSCPTGTTQLDFQLLDATANPETALLPQLLNAVLKKGKQSSEITQVVSASSQELTLSGGNGTYNLMLDTMTGTNLNIKTAQSYTVQYHCYNSEDGDVNTKLSNGLKAGVDSAIKTIKNKAKATLSFNCAKNAKLKELGNTEKLYIKLTNKTSPQQTSPFLTGVVYKMSSQSAISATDFMGDDNYGDKVSLKSGAGDYSIVIATTATDTIQDNAKSYSFQYSCMNAAKAEQAATLSTLEDN